MSPKGEGPLVKPIERKDLLKAAEDRFDLLVIGGGASGAGVALEAASRGLKTLLVEKHDFSAQTSSRSTKLVHGGVRYLEAAVKRFDRVQWNLVKDALHERAVFFKIAPHLAWPIELLTPLYRTLEIPYILAGLKLYEALAGRAGIGRSYFVPAKEAKERFPQLRAEGLKGAVAYSDGQFDDARMNLALVLTALSEGAVVLNHAAAVGFLKENGKLVGAEIEDRRTGARFAVRARMVVNATGPFADRVRRLDDPEAEPLLATSSGVHLVLPERFAPRDTGLLIPRTEDGRVLFVLPWQGHTLAGTTDEPAPVSEHPLPSEREIAYLIRHLNRHFDLEIGPEDVRSAWSGLRPLVKDPRAKDTARLARDHVILESESGLVTLAGGKWTTYRKMAEDLVNYLNRTRELGLPPSRSAELVLLGGRNYDPKDEKELARLTDPETASHLAHTYGDAAHDFLKFARETHGMVRLVPGLPYLEAEVRWAARFELAETPLDFLLRRTRLAFLELEAARKALPRVTEILAEEKGYGPAEAEGLRREAEEWLALAP